MRQQSVAIVDQAIVVSLQICLLGESGPLGFEPQPRIAPREWPRVRHGKSSEDTPSPVASVVIAPEQILGQGVGATYVHTRVSLERCLPPARHRSILAAGGITTTYMTVF